MKFTKNLIAPCGVNCGVCIAYLREKNKCCSCTSSDTNKPDHCKKCSIKFCDEHSKSEFTYYYECTKFPCTRLKRLDKRYVEKYHLSLIGNLTFINKYGFDEFVINENEIWRCTHCGKVLCVHINCCLNCGVEYRE